MSRPRQAFRVGTEAGLLLGVLGGILWATGRPFVFPSLGPTAFVLALRPRQHSARNVIGGHLWGVIGGLVAYHLLATGLVLTALPPERTIDAARLGTSGAFSVLLTSIGMILTRTAHAPACATTLIVSLGLLTSPMDGVAIMTAVATLQALHWSLCNVWPKYLPPRCEL